VSSISARSKINGNPTRAFSSAGIEGSLRPIFGQQALPPGVKVVLDHAPVAWIVARLVLRRRAGSVTDRQTLGFDLMWPSFRLSSALEVMTMRSPSRTGTKRIGDRTAVFRDDCQLADEGSVHQARNRIRQQGHVDLRGGTKMGKWPRRLYVPSGPGHGPGSHRRGGPKRRWPRAAPW